MGRGPSTAITEAASSALALQEEDDLSFTSGPNHVHPPGHTVYALRLPTAGDARGTHFRQAFESAVPFLRRHCCLCTMQG